VAWPQKTHLLVELPVTEIPREGGDGEVSQQPTVANTDPAAPFGGRVIPEELHLRVARGSDVPVLVYVEGVVPDEVTLHFKGGQTTVLNSGGTDLFRTRLPSIQGDTSFHVTGGDDLDGRPLVVLEVLEPPDVADLALTVDPPRYSGLESTIISGGDADVLAGSHVTVHVRPDPDDAQGLARILPADRTHELAARPFPTTLTPPAADGEPQAEPLTALGFEFVANEDIRYRFELTDHTGLENPDPGLYAIRVRPDRRPELSLVAPGRAEVDVVPGGALAVRVRIDDDFGIGLVEWNLTDSDGERLGGDPLGIREITEEGLTPLSAATSPARRGLAHRRLEVNDIGDSVSEGDLFILQVRALDNREPEPSESLSAPVRLRVVSKDEYLRRMHDDLARAGEQAGRLARQLEERLTRAREVQAALASDDSPDADAGSSVAVLLTGARRSQGDARALSRDLAAIAEGLVYSRVDERAEGLLDELDAQLAESSDKSFQPGPWLRVAAAHPSTDSKNTGLAGRLVTIVGMALTISEDQARTIVDELTNALDSSDRQELLESLDIALATQEAALESANTLLELLAEWDNYNSILTMTRDLINRQRNLKERTKQFADDQGR